MSLRQRILGLIAGLWIALILIVTILLANFSSYTQVLDRLAHESLTVRRITEHLNRHVLQLRLDIWDTLIFEPEERLRKLVDVENRARSFYQGLRDLAEADPGQNAAAERLRHLFQPYIQFGVTLLSIDGPESLRSLRDTADKFRANQAALLQVLETIQNQAAAQFDGALVKLAGDLAGLTLHALWIAVLVGGLSLALAFFTGGRIAGPLERLTRLAGEVAQGRFDLRPDFQARGETGALIRAFEVLLEKVDAYSQRMEDLVRVRTAALANANQTLVRQLRLARSIQLALMPGPGLDLGPLKTARLYQPMEQLGGDFYDLRVLGPNLYELIIADVSGHGVPAALLTAMLKVSLDSHRSASLSPAALVDQVNRDLCRSKGQTSQFLTLLVLRLDLEAQSLSYCGAGHNEALLYRADGRLERLEPNAPAIGLRSDEVFTARSAPWRPGDSLVLFTDGLTDLVAADGRNRLELAGLEALLGPLMVQAPASGLEALMIALSGFHGDRPPEDDLTLVWARWEPGTEGQPDTSADCEDPAPETGYWEDLAPRLYCEGRFTELIRLTEPECLGGLDPGAEAERWHWRALCELQLGRLEAARQDLRRCRELMPQNSRYRRHAEAVEAL